MRASGARCRAEALPPQVAPRGPPPPPGSPLQHLRRADERQERAARNLVQSFAFGAPGVGGGHRHERRGRPSARESLLSRAAVAWAAGPERRRRRC
jgi:hypothetical protein